MAYQHCVAVHNLTLSPKAEGCATHGPYLSVTRRDSLKCILHAGPDGRQAPSDKQGASEASASSSSDWADDSFLPGEDNSMFGGDSWEAQSSGRGGNEATSRSHGRQSMWFRQRHADQRHSSGAQPDAHEAREQMAAERASMAGGTVFDSRWDQQKGGPSPAGRKQRYDRDTGGTQFDSRWDNP